MISFNTNVTQNQHFFSSDKTESTLPNFSHQITTTRYYSIRISNNREVRRRIMKNIALLLSAIFFISLLSACAGTGMDDGMKVKCPTCSHEFNTGDPLAD